MAASHLFTRPDYAAFIFFCLLTEQIIKNNL